MHFVSGQVDTSKQTFAAGISKELSIRQFRGGRLRITANGPCRGSDISAELHFILKQIIQALGVHTDEDKISGLSTGLQAKAGPG